MDISIRRLEATEIDEVVAVSLLAWEPVFQSLEQVLGSTIFRRLHPDWRSSQGEAVAGVCRAVETYTVWVAERAAVIVGFVAYTLNHTDKIGEVYLMAVHPAHQNRGIGTALNTFALDQLKASGMLVAYVHTGGDPGHAPARRSFEKVGYSSLPVVHYYQAL